MQNTLTLASAGSGKTTRFIQMLQQCIHAGTPYEQIQILMFSKNAKCDFKERIKKENTKLTPKRRLKINSVNINTIHSLAYYIIKAIRNRGTEQDSFLFVELLVISALHLIKTVPSLVLELPKIKNLKLLLVDEAQDLNATEYEFICQLQQLLNANVCMVGDPKQTIFQMKFADSRLFMQHTYDKTDTLPNNYRSLDSILQVAHTVARQIEPTYVDQICIQTSADQQAIQEKPELYWGRRDFLMKRICNISRTALACNQTVGIIGSLKQGKQFSPSIGLQTVRQELKRQKINYFVHFKVENDEDNGIDKKQLRTKRVNLMTIHQSKGLEFDITIIIDPQHKLMNRLPSQEDIKAHRNLMYVAVTRAKKALYMFLTECSTPNTALNKAIGSNLISVILQKDMICSPPQNPRHNTKDYQNIMQRLQQDYTDDQHYIMNDIGELNKASECEIYTGLTKRIAIKTPIEESILISNITYGDTIRVKTGVASDIKTWDQRAVQGDKLHQSVNEVLGHYIQQGLCGEQIGLMLQKIDSGVSFQAVQHEFFFDKDFKLNEFKRIHKRTPNQDEKEHLDVLQQELSELACVSGQTMEDLFSYCVNKADISEQGAQQLIDTKFRDHLKSFANKYQAHYLKQTTEANWNTISEHLFSMYPIYKNIRESPISEVLRGKSKKCGTHTEGHYVNFNIKGIADLVNDEYVIELKFAKQFRSVYYTQLIMYSILLGPPALKKPQSQQQSQDQSQEQLISQSQQHILDHTAHTYKSLLPILFNIRTGEMQQLSLSTQFVAGFINKLQSFTAASRHVIAYDFETTGLDPNVCEIIEYCFYDVNSRIPICSSLVKPRGRIPEVVRSITGISDQMVSTAPNAQKLKDDVNQMKSRYINAILVAHNGQAFDQVILQRYARQLQFTLTEFSFQDSLYALRLFGSDKESSSLQSIYKQHISEANTNAHRAQGDCETLSDIMNHFNIVGSFSRLRLADNTEQQDQNPIE